MREGDVGLFEEDIAVFGHHLGTVHSTDSQTSVAQPARPLLLTPSVVYLIVVDCGDWSCYASNLMP